MSAGAGKKLADIARQTNTKQAKYEKGIEEFVPETNACQIGTAKICT